MRFIFLLCMLPLSAWTQVDTVPLNDSVKYSMHRFALVNEGGCVNGINLYGSGGASVSPLPGKYRVNGLDAAVFGSGHVVNGAAVSLLWSEMDSVNGVALCGAFADHGAMNGLAVTGFIGLNSETMNGASLAGFSQVNAGGNGLTVSGLTNVYDQNYNGLLLSGIYNRCQERFRGLGVAGGVQLFGDAQGFAGSGIVNISGGDFTGGMIAGICNIVGEEFRGIGISAAVNYAEEEAHGLLAAAINATPVMQGVQIGLVNYTNRLQGVQFGLINVNRANPKWCRVTPLVNFNFRPLHETDTLRQKGDSCLVLKSYFRDGKLASVSHYCCGKLNGVFTLYNTFGDKVRETNYRNGLKEGEELFFDGAGRLTESSFYHADTVTWNASYDYPEVTIENLAEKTLYYGDGRKATLGLAGKDTLYFFMNDEGYHASYNQADLVEAVYCCLYHGDSLLKIYWLALRYSFIDWDGPEIDSVVCIDPFVIPDGGFVVNVPVSEPGIATCITEMSIEGAIFSSLHYVVPITINAIDRNHIREQLVLAGHHPDSSQAYWYPGRQEFNVFDKKQLWIHLGPTGGTVYYSPGKIKRRFICDSTDIVNEGGEFIYYKPVTRIDYYPNGQKAFYQSPDSLMIWDRAGHPAQLECNDTVRTFYPNGRIEYLVTQHTLSYFDKKGVLQLSCNSDTIRTFTKTGSLARKMVLSGDSVTIFRFRKDSAVVEFAGPTRFYFHHRGRNVYQIIDSEPRSGQQRWHSENDSQTWFEWNGDALFREMKSPEESYGDGPVSPIRTTDWEYIYWPSW